MFITVYLLIKSSLCVFITSYNWQNFSTVLDFSSVYICVYSLYTYYFLVSKQGKKKEKKSKKSLVRFQKVQWLIIVGCIITFNLHY